VNNTNLHLISHRFPVIAEYWTFGQTCAVDTFYAVVRGEPLNSWLRNLASRYQRHRSMVWWRAYLDILNHLGVTHQCERQTDRRKSSQQMPLLTRAYVARPITRTTMPGKTLNVRRVICNVVNSPLYSTI